MKPDLLHTHEVTGSSPVVSTKKEDTQSGVLFFAADAGFEPIAVQHAGGMLLPPVQKLVTSSIFATPGAKMQIDK